MYNLHTDKMTVSNKRKLHHGVAVAILRSTLDAGEVKLTVTTDKLRKDSVKLKLN